MNSIQLAGSYSLMDQFVGSGLAVHMEYLFRIFLAAVFGMIIGHERKNRNKSAGIRTHAIVALGAALMMVVSKYGFADVEKVDASRIASQVVSGVGFLGAGVIFVKNNLVSGLTTSAGIWATAGVGLAMGSGMYVVGSCSTLLMVLMQAAMHRITFFNNVASNGYLRLTISQSAGAVKNMQNYLIERHVEIAGVKINKNKKDEIKLEFDVVYPPGFDKAKLLSDLVELDQVITVSE